MAASAASPATAAPDSPAAERVCSALEAEGFENLSVVEDADRRTVRILFENRRYRWEVVGLGVVLAIAARECDGHLVVIPEHTALPMLRIEVESADYRAFLRGELSEEEIFSRMRISPCRDERVTEMRNASAGKLDIAFAPSLRMNLATPAPPGVFTGTEVRANTSVSMNLGRGAMLDATYIYPLSNSSPSFSRAAVTWNARLDRNGAFQVQAGRLARDLTGVAAQVSYASDSGQHRVGLAAAQASYPGWKRRESHQLFYSWRPETVDVVATLSAGQFIKGDRGYSFSLFNGFKEHGIEFIYTATTLSRNTGVALTVPLGWQRQPRPVPIRVLVRNTFGFTYTDERPRPRDGGLAVPFSDSYQMALRRWTRAYLRAYARQLRDAGRKWAPVQ